MTLRVTREAFDRMLAEAKASDLNEACGILFGENRIEVVRPAGNVASDPRRRFEIDPQALVDAHRGSRAGGLPVLGYYHSHPVGPAEPSATDGALAAGDGMVWAIVGEGDVTFWRDDERGFARLSYVVEDR